MGFVILHLDIHTHRRAHLHGTANQASSLSIPCAQLFTNLHAYTQTYLARGALDLIPKCGHATDRGDGSQGLALHQGCTHDLLQSQHACCIYMCVRCVLEGRTVICFVVCVCVYKKRSDDVAMSVCVWVGLLVCVWVSLSSCVLGAAPAAEEESSHGGRRSDRHATIMSTYVHGM